LPFQHPRRVQVPRPRPQAPVGVKPSQGVEVSLLLGEFFICPLTPVEGAGAMRSGVMDGFLPVFKNHVDKLIEIFNFQ
jgi:hypothetical protein